MPADAIRIGPHDAMPAGPHDNHRENRQGNMKEGKLLIVDDNRGILSAVKLLADKYFAEVITLPSPNSLISVMRNAKADVVLLDMNFHAGINSGNEGIYWLGQLSEKYPETKVVLFTAYADIDLAVKAMKHGAVDFVVKPWDNGRLIASLQNAYRLSRRQSDLQKRQAKTQANGRKQEGPQMFWGESDAMARIREMAERVAVTDANILITGENGTGKEMLAREIHRLSTRRDAAMVSLDMGAIPDTLFESELFGHTKGAFTDAHADREGKFETASGGTLFLDEIGNLPLHLQAKLLTALQNRSIMRLGSNTPTPVDIRLITATNRDLFALSAGGEFRQDLLYRINTIHMDIPPLRRRQRDIVPLARIFLARYAAKYGRRAADFTAEAQKQLTAHAWEGNIRELQHTVEKAVIMSDGEAIDAGMLLLRPATSVTAEDGGASTLEDMERRMIRRTIAACNGNLTMVAQQLGITRQTLYNKIKRYGL